MGEQKFMSNSSNIYDILILGGGPAGYTAALFAARSGLKALILEKLSAGGQMALSHWIDNYPGFTEGIDGFSLAEKMAAQAHRFGAETIFAEIQSVDLASDIKTVHTSTGAFRGTSVIIATGSVPKPLGLSGESQLLGRGISYCASCDGMFYRGKTVAVIGGGNSAAENALLLSRVAKRVILIHRRETLRAEKISCSALFASQNVEFRWNCEVQELIHSDKLTALNIRNCRNGDTELIPCDGAFVCIGHRPASALFSGQLMLDHDGYILADETTATAIPGVFAAGDVRSKQIRQIVTATADGAIAAEMARGYLTGKEES